MKRILTILLLAVAAISASAKAFDTIFSTYSKTEGADYIKIPGLLVRLAASKVTQMPGVSNKIPLNIKVTGMRILDMSDCKASKSAFLKAVNKAAGNCELMLEAKDGEDKFSIWLEPKGAKTYNKMIILDEEDPALIELSGKFTPQ